MRTGIVLVSVRMTEVYVIFVVAANVVSVAAVVDLVAKSSTMAKNR